MGIKGKKARQQRRQQQQLQQQHLAETEMGAAEESSSLDLVFESSSPSPSTSTTTSPSSSSTSLSEIELEPEMAIPKIRNILLCSIGNPGALLTTRHSAGHILLSHLSTTGTLSNSRAYGGPVGPGPSGDKYTTTLFQSTSYMNVSGPAVSKAWKSFKSSNSNPVLVILHDELEKPVGKVKYKKDGSAGGHNGLSSIRSSLPGETLHKIGLGIGRPESREKNAVAEYVLKRMGNGDTERMLDEGLPLVMRMLEDIGSGKLK
ncbi:hypothetical protein H072_7193 [Dactylellina haptotyla CBS 200.50]|uniref:Peptidyl-tRNA hydrolase n=1 Tax=Dactylellina haptotyla (strain CBS 200.50) TaxID=1284197 RepID=S8BIA1_DACHA|nr:hypothetical protein H072_7193 [Dactylellina haptotyla CBS 200.50]